MSEANIRAVVVDPAAQTIQAVENLTHEAFDQLVRVTIGEDRSWSVLAPPGKLPGVQFVLHDWAVMQPEQRYFRIRDYPHPLGGKVIFVGFNREGETVALPEAVTHWLNDRVTWCPSTMRFLRIDTVEEKIPEGVQIVRRVVYEGEETKSQ